MSDIADDTARGELASDARLEDEAALDAWIDAQRSESTSQVRENFLQLTKAERGAVIARLEVRHGSRSPARMFSLFVPVFVIGVGAFMIAFLGGPARVFPLTILVLGAAVAVGSVVMLVNAGANAWKKELAVRLRLIYAECDVQR